MFAFSDLWHAETRTRRAISICWFDLDAERSLLDLGALVAELNESIGRRTDVVTERGIRNRIRDRIVAETVAL